MPASGPHLALLAALTLLLAGCTTPDESQPAVENPVEPCGALDKVFQPDLRYAPRATLETTNGTIVVALLQQQVPLTAGNFIDLALQGLYDDTRFHQLRPGLFIQGGDPLTTEPSKRFWGTGGPGYAIPDEFHFFLRHDRPGTVSMATAQPNTGGSQFLITLDALPGLDDRNAIFGRVIEGLDVAHDLASTPRDDRDRPEFNAKLHNVTIRASPSNPRNASVALTAYGLDCVQAAEPGGQAEFLTVLRNTGQRVLNGTFQADLPDGWNASIRNSDVVAVASGQSVAYILDIDVPASAEKRSHTFNATFADKRSDATVQLELTVNVGELGASPVAGDQATLQSVGVLEDGRLFATTMPEFASDPQLEWFGSPPSDADALAPFVFTLGEDQLRIPGLVNLTARAQTGGSVVGAIPPSQAYGSESWGPNDLGGRLLIFQLDLDAVE